MPYKIERAKEFKEVLELVDENGSVTKTLVVELVPEASSLDFRKRYNRLIVAEGELNAAKDDETKMTAYGQAVIQMFELVFGEQNTVDMLEFFENRYTEMLLQVLPFIINVVSPVMSDYIKESREKAAEMYVKRPKKKWRR